MAIDLNGTTDGITFSSESMDVLSTSWTVVCWFTTDQLTTLKGLGAQSVLSNNQQQCVLFAGSFANDPIIAYATVPSVTEAFGKKDTNASIGVWYHAAGQFLSGRSSRTAYFQGVAGTTDTTFVGLAGPLNMLYVGRSPGTFHDGKLAAWALYEAQLTADEMISLARGFSPRRVRPQSLRKYMPLVREPIAWVNTSGVAPSVSGTSTVSHPRSYGM